MKSCIKFLEFVSTKTDSCVCRCALIKNEVNSDQLCKWLFSADLQQVSENSLNPTPFHPHHPHTHTTVYSSLSRIYLSAKKVARYYPHVHFSSYICLFFYLCKTEPKNFYDCGETQITN